MFLFRLFFVVMLLTAAGIKPAWSLEMVTFSPHDASIEGSIKYSVIGRYTAHFNNFKGTIILDPASGRILSVDLEIVTASIKSDHPLCDRIARSKRLLNAARYPKIVFKSKEIVYGSGGYKVKGVLDMHGTRKEMTFPYIVTEFMDRKLHRKLLDIKGAWSINRKDFNIVWNRYIDHGGVLVGDDFIVSWEVKVHIKSYEK